MLERGSHAEHVRIGLAVHGTGEPVAVDAADAGAVRHVRLVEADAAGCMEGVESSGREIVRKLLDPRLVGHRWEGIRSARRRLRGVLPPRAVHLVQLLRLRVVGLQLVVGDRPGGRDPVVVAELAEVLFPEPVQRGPVELGRPADEVVHLGLERLALYVVPRVGRDVPVVHEDVLREPVLRLARQPVAALEQEDALPRGGKVPGKRAAACTGADDDDVVVLHAFAPYWAIQGPCQPPWPRTSSSASAGPHDPGLYACTGGGAFRSGCMTRQVSSTASCRVKRMLSPAITA